MIYPALVSSEKELQEILQLQKENHLHHIDEIEMRTQGFLTLQHDHATLKHMHDLAPSVIVKDESKVVAYALAMLRECRQLIPDLEPMFALFDHLTWQNKPLNNYRFYVMGQVCIAKAWRGRGVFEQLYNQHKKVYSPRFDLLVTEISARNLRSLRAHEKQGFKTIHIHRDKLDDWHVVAWDWS